MVEIDTKYDAFYRKRNPIHVYPVEFVVRAFLGNYPRHRTDPVDLCRQEISGSWIW